MYAMHIPHADWRDPRPSQSPHKGQRKNGRAVASARIDYLLTEGKGHRWFPPWGCHILSANAGEVGMPRSTEKKTRNSAVSLSHWPVRVKNGGQNISNQSKLGRTVQYCTKKNSEVNHEETASLAICHLSLGANVGEKFVRQSFQPCFL